ncbi:cytochrome-c peroxidase [bacterium]|nr:cytochrome-c peroxidase [bacterium]
MKRSWPALAAAIAAASLLAGCGWTRDPDDPQLDRALSGVLAANGVTPLLPPPPHPPAKVELGRMLFFEKLLSGNKDISCATCHNPAFHSTDGLSVTIGTGGHGAGPGRQVGTRGHIGSRNTQDLYNRGDLRFTHLFWDSRVTSDRNDPFAIVFGDSLEVPPEHVLGEQALLPIIMRDEQLGSRGDIAVDGTPNELAQQGLNVHEIWNLQMARLLQLPEYHQLFAAAYPDAQGEYSIGHAVNAIAAFEASAFVSNDSPLDRFIAGDHSALSPAAKRGGLLFYGEAGCANCHSGNLFTDFEHHCIAVPQVGAGRRSAFGEEGEDVGLEDVTSAPEDAFLFRTPPLRNVELTGPYMHDGCYSRLEDAVRQHLDPLGMLRSYSGAGLSAHIKGEVLTDSAALARIEAQLDPLLHDPPELTQQQLSELIAFLKALTGEGARDQRELIPARVPSGLPVED